VNIHSGVTFREGVSIASEHWVLWTSDIDSAAAAVQASLSLSLSILWTADIDSAAAAVQAFV